MKKGFTLAEVLITLAVIGIVAALTIPVVMNKYQKKALYTQFMKAYNTMSSAMENAAGEYGSVSGWNWGKAAYQDDPEVEGNSPFENYVLKQLKAVKTCETATDCFASSYTNLSGDSINASYLIDDDLPSGVNAAILADGMVIGVRNHDSSSVDFAIDTNGKKGPNVLGRDLFYISYGHDEYDTDGEDGIFLEPYSSDTTPDSSGYSRANCDTESSSTYGTNGIGCASKLIQEGKMDY